ncbi:MAG TPA: ATP-binding cassette domain-containing protein [Myxococcota bacterium]|nr:ATP-binding cassette domain-containing protein [Myxococcota bacterium]
MRVRQLSLGYGDFTVQRDVDFQVERGRIFIVMGDSGSGKSTLLRSMIGLQRPAAGDVLYDEESFWSVDDERRSEMKRRFGVLFQSGALWSSMTLAENVELPLLEFGRFGAGERREVVSFKLALVGLAGFEEFYPSQISGGMQKRAGLARAMALDPDILFFDEPSAGLDPLSARRLDDLILELRASLRTTFVVVTHELESIFAIADDSVFLDGEAHTMTARGNPRWLREHCPVAKVRDFLNRGSPAAGTGAGDRP